MPTENTMKRGKAGSTSGENSRPPQGRFRLFVSLFAVGLCSLSTALQAAEVVDMRLGRHSDYTRIVFELDAPAGYRLEQGQAEGGSTELVVTLDARASDKSEMLHGSLVRDVTLTGVGARSVARITIPRTGLRVKEMILSAPPRIVLDVLAANSPQTKAGSMSVPEPKASPVLPDTPKGMAPVAPRRTQSPAPVASINKGAPRAAPPVNASAAAKPVVAARPKAAPAPAKQPIAVAATPPRPAPAKTPVPAFGQVRPAKTPAPPARKKPSLPAAPAAIPQSPDLLLTPTNLGAGLALLALVGGGTWFMMRRRGDEERADEEDFDQDGTPAGHPFAALGEALEVDADPGRLDATSEVSLAAELIPEADIIDEFASDDTPIAKTAEGTGAQEGLFDSAQTELISAIDDEQDSPGGEATETAGDEMEAHGDLVAPQTEAMSTMSDSGKSDDVVGMLRDFEQRVAGLESRLDEVKEAKERLERQVAAQTEELRVQRAAIARTQRALRNLSRSDDESPTEPALRGDPNG